MRLLKHPGRPSQPRREIAVARSGGEWRVTLAPGVGLEDGLLGALASRGIGQAALQLLSGGFESLAVRTPEADGEGGPISVLSQPRALDGPATLVGGGGLLGRDADGRPVLHCHGLVVDRAGRLAGGRLVPEACRVGADGLVVLVAALAGAGFVETHDAETDSILFQPLEGDA